MCNKKLRELGLTNNLSDVEYATLKYRRNNGLGSNNPGTVGFSYIKKYTNFLDIFIPHNISGITGWNSHIVQYAKDDAKGRQIEGYCQIDANSAYFSILTTQALPVAYLGTKYVEDAIPLYVQLNGKADFKKPKDTKFYQTHYFKKGYLSDYGLIEALDKLPKKHSKQLKVAGIGYMSSYVEGCVIAQWIWYIQSLSMKHYSQGINLLGGEIIKMHTDSIGFINKKQVPKEVFIDKLGLGAGAMKYKLEHYNDTIYIVHQSMYQVKGYEAKGLPIEYQDTGKLIEWGTGREIPIDTWSLFELDVVVEWITVEDKVIKRPKKFIDLCKAQSKEIKV